MKLLLVNFAMDRRSPVLAWQQRVAHRLAQQCEQVTVLTGHAGEFESAPNLEVHAVPKFFARWPGRVLGAKKLMNVPVGRWCRRRRFDACFMHMTYEWSYLLEPTLRRWNLPVLLWYAHGTVTPALHRALAAVDRVVTSTPEGFRIPSPKVRVIGQAIDTDLFQLRAKAADRNVILYVGRISPRKRIDLLIDVMAVLRKQPRSAGFVLRLVGPVLNAGDETYLAEMKAKAAALGLASSVEFRGPLGQWELPAAHEGVFTHLNVSETGSMDKTVMESLAMGCPVLTCNEAIVPVLREAFPRLVLEDRSAEAIAAQVCALHRDQEILDPAGLRAIVAGRHDLDHFIAEVLKHLGEIARAGRGRASHV